jgi:hypothetical protein
MNLFRVSRVVNYSFRVSKLFFRKKRIALNSPRMYRNKIKNFKFFFFFSKSNLKVPAPTNFLLLLSSSYISYLSGRGSITSFTTLISY